MHLVRQIYNKAPLPPLASAAGAEAGAEGSGGGSGGGAEAGAEARAEAGAVAGAVVEARMATGGSISQRRARSPRAKTNPDPPSLFIGGRRGGQTRHPVVGSPPSSELDLSFSAHWVAGNKALCYKPPRRN